VGKSATVVSFVQGIFVETYDPTIEDYYRKSITVDNEATLLEVLDPAGPEEFSSLLTMFIRNSEAYMYIVSVDDVMSLDNMEYLMNAVLRMKDIKQFPALVVAINKVDLDESEHVVTEKMITDILQKLPVFNYAIFKISAKRGLNINKAFEELIRIYKLRLIDLVDIVLQILQKDKKILNMEKKKCSLM